MNDRVLVKIETTDRLQVNDIYENLHQINFKNDHEETDVAKGLREKNQDLEAKVKDLVKENEDLKHKYKCLQERMSSLILTARAELARNKTTITNLTEELDNMKFRRGPYRRTVTAYNHDDKRSQCSNDQDNKDESQLKLSKMGRSKSPVAVVNVLNSRRKSKERIRDRRSRERGSRDRPRRSRDRSRERRRSRGRPRRSIERLKDTHRSREGSREMRRSRDRSRDMRRSRDRSRDMRRSRDRSRGTQKSRDRSREWRSSREKKPRHEKETSKRSTTREKSKDSVEYDNANQNGDVNKSEEDTNTKSRSIFENISEAIIDDLPDENEFCVLVDAMDMSEFVTLDEDDDAQDSVNSKYGLQSIDPVCNDNKVPFKIGNKPLESSLRSRYNPTYKLKPKESRVDTKLEPIERSPEKPCRVSATQELLINDFKDLQDVIFMARNYGDRKHDDADTILGCGLNSSLIETLNCAENIKPNFQKDHLQEVYLRHASHLSSTLNKDLKYSSDEEPVNTSDAPRTIYTIRKMREGALRKAKANIKSIKPSQENDFSSSKIKILDSELIYQSTSKTEENNDNPSYSKSTDDIGDWDIAKSTDNNVPNKITKLEKLERPSDVGILCKGSDLINKSLTLNLEKNIKNCRESYVHKKTPTKENTPACELPKLSDRIGEKLAGKIHPQNRRNFISRYKIPFNKSREEKFRRKIPTENRSDKTLKLKFRSPNREKKLRLKIPARNRIDKTKKSKISSQTTEEKLRPTIATQNVMDISIKFDTHDESSIEELFMLKKSLEEGIMNENIKNANKKRKRSKDSVPSDKLKHKSTEKDYKRSNNRVVPASLSNLNVKNEQLSNFSLIKQEKKLTNCDSINNDKNYKQKTASEKIVARGPPGLDIGIDEISGHKVPPENSMDETLKIIIPGQNIISETLDHKITYLDSILYKALTHKISSRDGIDETLGHSIPSQDGIDLGYKIPSQDRINKIGHKIPSQDSMDLGHKIASRDSMDETINNIIAKPSQGNMVDTLRLDIHSQDTIDETLGHKILSQGGRDKTFAYKIPSQDSIDTTLEPDIPKQNCMGETLGHKVSAQNILDQASVAKNVVENGIESIQNKNNVKNANKRNHYSDSVPRSTSEHTKSTENEFIKNNSITPALPSNSNDSRDDKNCIVQNHDNTVDGDESLVKDSNKIKTHIPHVDKNAKFQEIKPEAFNPLKTLIEDFYCSSDEDTVVSPKIRRKENRKDHINANSIQPTEEDDADNEPGDISEREIPKTISATENDKNLTTAVDNVGHEERLMVFSEKVTNSKVLRVIHESKEAPETDLICEEETTNEIPMLDPRLHCNISNKPQDLRKNTSQDSELKTIVKSYWPPDCNPPLEITKKAPSIDDSYDREIYIPHFKKHMSSPLTGKSRVKKERISDVSTLYQEKSPIKCKSINNETGTETTTSETDAACGIPKVDDSVDPKMHAQNIMDESLTLPHSTEQGRITIEKNLKTTKKRMRSEDSSSENIELNKIESNENCNRALPEICNDFSDAELVLKTDERRSVVTKSTKQTSSTSPKRSTKRSSGKPVSVNGSKRLRKHEKVRADNEPVSTFSNEIEQPCQPSIADNEKKDEKPCRTNERKTRNRTDERKNKNNSDPQKDLNTAKDHKMKPPITSPKKTQNNAASKVHTNGIDATISTQSLQTMSNEDDTLCHDDSSSLKGNLPVAHSKQELSPPTSRTPYFVIARKRNVIIKRDLNNSIV